MMEIEIIVPKLYEDLEAGILLKWLKQVGECVDVGDSLYSLETDKAAFDIEAEEEGILKTIVREGNSAVKVLEVVGYLESSD